MNLFFAKIATAVTFTLAAGAAFSAPLNVLHIGSHLTNYTSVGAINVTKVNSSGVNAVDLSMFDVVYADEHANFGTRTNDIKNAIQSGALGFVGALAPISNTNAVLGTSMNFSWGGVSSLTATTAPSALLSGAGLTNGAAVNLANVNNQSRARLSGSGWNTVLVQDQLNRPVIVEGTLGQGNWIYMGLEPMEFSSPNADERQLVWNALQIAAGTSVAPVPLPAGLPLMLAGAGVIAVMGRRRRAA